MTYTAICLIWLGLGILLERHMYRKYPKHYRSRR